MPDLSRGVARGLEAVGRRGGGEVRGMGVAGWGVLLEKSRGDGSTGSQPRAQCRGTPPQFRARVELPTALKTAPSSVTRQG